MARDPDASTGTRCSALHVDDPERTAGHQHARGTGGSGPDPARSARREELMLAGVTIERPETVTIDAQASRWAWTR